ncbi:MAG TPA: hypothetical protein VJ792_07665 [Candidatus Nitrosotalea sp.]|nr:hypothetical protein [Candidatus Nitrosotalea sp.]
MNHLKTMGLFGVVAIAVGMVGIGGVNASTFGLADTPKTDSAEKTSMLGHIIVTVRDPSGHIKEYRQTDNVVTATGHNCAANLLFGTGFANCTSPAVAKYIALSSSTTSAQYNASATALTGELASNGLQRVAGTVTANTVAVGGGSAVAQVANTFTYSGVSAQVVGGAGLLDAPSTGNLFADKQFGSSVTLNQNDQLTVQWQVTLS